MMDLSLRALVGGTIAIAGIFALLAPVGMNMAKDAKSHATGGAPSEFADSHEPDSPRKSPTKPKTRRNAAPAVAGAGEVLLLRGPDSHFRTNVHVDGADIPMLVDSGASTVVLTAQDAARAGVTVDPNQFTGTAETANGPVKVQPVTLSMFKLGSIEIRNVRAVVVAEGLDQSLLGQSALSQFREVKITGDEMRIR